jgi:hypothetical protein
MPNKMYSDKQKKRNNGSPQVWNFTSASSGEASNIYASKLPQKDHDGRLMIKGGYRGKKY